MKYLAGYLESNRTLIEDQWCKLLYRSAEKSRNRKKKEILHILDFEKEQLNLENLNEVCLGLEKKEALNWINKSDSNERCFGAKILNLTMGCLKRGESLFSLLNVLNKGNLTKELRNGCRNGFSLSATLRCVFELCARCPTAWPFL